MCRIHTSYCVFKKLLDDKEIPFHFYACKKSFNILYRLYTNVCVPWVVLETMLHVHLISYTYVSGVQRDNHISIETRTDNNKVILLWCLCIVHITLSICIDYIGSTIQIYKTHFWFLLTLFTPEVLLYADRLIKIQLSRVMRKPTFWFPTWSNTNQAVQLQKMDRGLKFRFQKIEGLYYLCSENKGADQLHGYREADLRL